MDIFDYITQDSNKTLADRMRPKVLDDFIGQSHILSKNNLLYKSIIQDKLPSCIFYGPPGCGKTTLANIIANTTKSNFIKLNAVSSGVQDAKRVIDESKNNFKMYGKKTVLYLDECHRWNKAQSDSILEEIENGTITFIGSTTENPFVSMTRAIVSRSQIFSFKPLKEEEVIIAIKRAISDKTNGYGNYNINVSEDDLKYLASFSNGDIRSALNALEMIMLTAKIEDDNSINITRELIQDSMQSQNLSINNDMYYDILSAFCKSLRGSDSNAALYYAERLISAGCDPLIILRRLIVHSSEDVGMADPNALVVATSALTAFLNIGLPEGKIPLYNAIIYVCEAPKSNSVVVAKYAVEDLVKNKKDDNIPSYLRDRSYSVDKNELGEYLYPHDFGGYVEQQYLPNSLKKESLYIPKNIGFEKEIIKRKLERNK